jgi:4'-phosphopantetheinyl transferase
MTTDDAVHTWRIPLRAEPAACERLYRLLSPAERRRADARPEQGRRRYVVAHAAMRTVLCTLLDVKPQRLRLRRGACGKPFVVGGAVEFNLSHEGDLALLAVSPLRPVGVDLATCRPGFPARAMAARYFPAAERTIVERAGKDARQAWLTLWARKEAWVKATGTRLSVGLPVPVAGRRAVTRDPTGRVPGWWRLHDLPAPPGFAACVALAGTRGFDVINQGTFDGESLIEKWGT